MKKFAVIVAGGVGSRMGNQVPKQFLLLRGQPVLWHTLKVFLQAYEDLAIILVLPEEHLEKGRAVAGALAHAGAAAAPAGAHADGVAERIIIVTGGDSRFHSVQNGLREVETRLSADQGANQAIGDGGEDAVIFVHDGVRCLLTAGLVQRCCEQAMRLGSAVPVVECRDSVRVLTADATGDGGKDGAGMGHSEVLDRGRVRLVQTPQTFLGSLLLPAYRTAYQEDFTDESTVVEAAGHLIHLVEGEPFNIKIT
jgi:2-C-methyl-D-erythritol 4-phosphate cytidylyltransferase